MDLRSNLARIQTPSDHCLEGSLARAWIKGEASMQEWATGVAVAEASRAGGVMPRVYPPMPQALRNYCENRSHDRIPYDEAMSRSMGNWFGAVQSVYEFNQERLNHYLWAAQLTTGIGADEANKILRAAVERFTKVTPNCDDIRMCLHVKKLDAFAREKRSKD